MGVCYGEAAGGFALRGLRTMITISRSAQKTYVMGATKAALFTDRAALIDLDVPMDVPAVVVIEHGRCKHVLPIAVLQDIVATFEKMQR
jgi:hypothetical protein